MNANSYSVDYSVTLRENGRDVRAFAFTSTGYQNVEAAKDDFDGQIRHCMRLAKITEGNLIVDVTICDCAGEYVDGENDIGVYYHDGHVSIIDDTAKENSEKEVTESFFCPAEINLEPDFVGAEEDISLRSIRKELERSDDGNMADCFDGSKSLREILVSIEWGVEKYDYALYGRIDVVTKRPMTPKERAEIIDWITGQNSDGFGEVFEQHRITCYLGTFSVSFYNSSDEYFVLPETEFYKNILKR